MSEALKIALMGPRQDLMPQLMSPQQQQYNRRAAASQFKDATSIAPVRHWTQAAAQVLGGLGSSMRETYAAEDDQARAQAQKEALMQALNGGDLSASAQMLMGNPGTADMGAQLAGQIISNRMRTPADTRTAGMKEYQYAKEQGFDGSFMDYQLAKRRAAANNINVNTAGETSYDKEIGKQLATEFTASQAAGGKASRDLSDLRVMEQSLANPSVYTGTGGETVNALKKAAGTLFGMDVEGVEDAEVIKRISSEIALGMKDKLPGPMSDSDRRFLMELPPGLGSSPEGARRLVQLGIAQQQWQLERSQRAREYAANNNGRLDPGFYSAVSDTDAKWARTMSGLVDKLRKQPQAERRSPFAGIPDQAIRDLEANPSSAPLFDEVFGQGAAQKVLGR